MARLKRIDLPFTLYHVMSRTNSGDIAFRDHADFHRFLSYLQKYIRMFDFRLHAYCLLPNHFHLLVESGKDLYLSEFMRRLLTAYTIYFNRRNNRHGHLFQGRFKSLVVEKNDYYLAVSRYIHTNPARLEKPVEPSRYEWSSLRYYLQGGEPDWLYTKDILTWFDGDRIAHARFVEEGMDQEISSLIMNRRFVGGEAFAARYSKRAARHEGIQTGDVTGSASASFAYAEKLLQTVCSEFHIQAHLLRMHVRRKGPNRAVVEAKSIVISILRSQTTWTCRQIADFLGIKSISMVYRHLDFAENDAEIRNICMKILEKLPQASL